MKTTSCPRCGYVNPLDAKYCFNCSYAFDEKAVFEEQKKSEEEIKALKKRIAELVKAKRTFF